MPVNDWHWLYHWLVIRSRLQERVQLLGDTAAHRKKVKLNSHLQRQVLLSVIQTLCRGNARMLLHIKSTTYLQDCMPCGLQSGLHCPGQLSHCFQHSMATSAS